MRLRFLSSTADYGTRGGVATLLLPVLAGMLAFSVLVQYQVQHDREVDGIGSIHAATAKDFSAKHGQMPLGEIAETEEESGEEEARHQTSHTKTCLHFAKRYNNRSGIFVANLKRYSTNAVLPLLQHRLLENTILLQ